MIKTKNILTCSTVIFTLCILFFSCKERYNGIDLTKPAVDPDELLTVSSITTEPDTASSFTKNILIEDFTGEKCINCPTGHDKLKSISNTYKGRIMLLAIHSNSKALGSIAKPLYPLKQDLRTDEGTKISEAYGVAGKLPAAVINRRKFSGALVSYDVNNWKQFSDSEIVRTSPVKIDSVSIQFDSVKNLITGTLKIRYASAITDSDYLSIAVKESNILGSQENGAKIDTQYIHNNILRKFLSPLNGVKLSGTIKQGTVFNIKFSTKADAKWKIGNVKIIAIVHKQTGTDYSVSQVKEFSVK